MHIVCFFVFLISLLQGCSLSSHSYDYKYPSKFSINVDRDLLETHDGKTFSANLNGVHPVLGNAIKIKVRGLIAESLTDPDPKKSSLAFRQWHRFTALLKEAQTIDIRDLERGKGGFWVLADVYVDDFLITGSL